MIQGVLRVLEDGGLSYWCPGCQENHRVYVAPTTRGPVWGWNGDYQLPTFTPSVLSNPGRENPGSHICHHFVRNGRIEYLADCSHFLAGQIVPMTAP